MIVWCYFEKTIIFFFFTNSNHFWHYKWCTIYKLVSSRDCYFWNIINQIFDDKRQKHIHVTSPSFSRTTTERARIWDWFKCYFKAILDFGIWIYHRMMGHGEGGERERDRERERDVKTQFERRNSKIVVRPTAATLRRTSKWNYATLHNGDLGAGTKARLPRTQYNNLSKGT